MLTGCGNKEMLQKKMKSYVSKNINKTLRVLVRFWIYITIEVLFLAGQHFITCKVFINRCDGHKASIIRKRTPANYFSQNKLEGVKCLSLKMCPQATAERIL